jgi:hypothetical protein
MSIEIRAYGHRECLRWVLTVYHSAGVGPSVGVFAC